MFAYVRAIKALGLTPVQAFEPASATAGPWIVCLTDSFFRWWAPSYDIAATAVSIISAYGDDAYIIHRTDTEATAQPACDSPAEPSLATLFADRLADIEARLSDHTETVSNRIANIKSLLSDLEDSYS